MSIFSTRSRAVALALGVTALFPAASFAAPAGQAPSLVVPVSSTGWAARAEGKNFTYSPPYYAGYGYGYRGDPAWGYQGGYAGPGPYGEDYAPYGYGGYDDDEY